MSDHAVSEVWWAAGILFLVFLGFRMGYVGAARRSHRDFEVMERQVAAHLQSAERQLELRYAADRERRLSERVEEAYAALARWLHDLDRTVDEAWAGAVTSEESVRLKAEHILNAWPWETLRIPLYAAPAQLYWSSEIRALWRKFGGASAAFVMFARAEIIGREMPRPASGFVPGSELFQAREDLHMLIGEIRDQARTDLGVR